MRPTIMGLQVWQDLVRRPLVVGEIREADVLQENTLTAGNLENNVVDKDF